MNYDVNKNGYWFSADQLVDHDKQIGADERTKHFNKIMSFINTPNRGNCDYFIIDQIEDYIRENKR